MTKQCYDRVVPDGILASMFLNNASILDSNEKLIQATLTDLSSEMIKTQLKKNSGI